MPRNDELIDAAAAVGTTVVLGRDRSAPLRDLLPEYGWPAPLDRGGTA